MRRPVLGKPRDLSFATVQQVMQDNAEVVKSVGGGVLMDHTAAGAVYELVGKYDRFTLPQIAKTLLLLFEEYGLDEEENHE